MKNIKYEILRFLIDGKAYSNNAIMKNFGLSIEEVEKIYLELQNEGCLMSYAEYEKIEKATKQESSCRDKESCKTCPSLEDCSDKKECQVELDMDKSKILVLTEKAFLVDRGFD